MIVGTAGHIDHGKTSLVRALTGVDTDRLKEEKARGISIELGFAYLPAPEGSIVGFIDVPGHEKFVHTMLAGATGIDFVLLVVAADDGIMPQTREHLAIVDLLGIERGLVALTKTDLVPTDARPAVENDIRQLLAPTKLAEAEIIPVSIVTGEGVDALRSRLFEAAHSIKARAARGRFRLAVDRSFTLAGAGTVVTGTVLSGSVAIDDKVIVSSRGLEARVRSIHAQNQRSERGVAGERCALNLAGDGVTKEAIVRGDMVVEPSMHAPTERIDAEVSLLAEAKPITQWMPAHLHHAASDIGARIVLLGEIPLQPGATALVQLVLDKPIVAAVGDRFVLRDTTARRTIGGGRLLDLRAPARKRRTPERLARLQACAIPDAEQALMALLDRAPFYLDLSGFARDRALTDDEIIAVAARINATKIAAGATTLALSSANWLRLKRTLLETLKKFHAEHPDLPGIGLEALRMQLQPLLPVPGFRSFLQGFSGEIALDGAWVRLASHSVRLTPEDEKLWHRITPLLGGDKRFRPPRVRDIAGSLGVRESVVRRLLKLVGRMGKADEVAHDHFFLRPTVAEMVSVICQLNSDKDFSAAQFRDRLDNGRKVAIQILEFFDRHGVTLRRGDLRRLNKHRVELFGPQGRESSPVGRPDFKSGRGREPVLGGFDSLSLPPRSWSA